MAMEPFFYDKDYPVICEEGRVVMKWPDCFVVFDRPDRLFLQRDHSLFAAFAIYPQDFIDQIHVFECKMNQLADSDAGL